jgi:hypothetical protein
MPPFPQVQGMRESVRVPQSELHRANLPSLHLPVYTSAAFPAGRSCVMSATLDMTKP